MTTVYYQALRAAHNSLIGNSPDHFGGWCETTVDMDKTDVLVTIVVWYPGGAYYLVNRRTAQLV